MKTVKQRKMANRELKLAIGDELQTLFHPIVNATKQAAEETRKEIESMKKTLADNDGTLKSVAEAPGSRVKNLDNTFGIYRGKDAQLLMGSKIVKISKDGTILNVDDVEYGLTPGNVVCVMYDTTSGKSLLWINHRKVRDFACRLTLKASTLNLFNRVVHFDGASGFDGYIESVEMYNYYKSIPTGLIAARMTYLCEKFKIPKRADGSTI